MFINPTTGLKILHKILALNKKLMYNVLHEDKVYTKW